MRFGRGSALPPPPVVPGCRADGVWWVREAGPWQWTDAWARAFANGPIIIHITSLIILIAIIEAASPAALPAASTIIIIQTGRGQRHGRQADGRTLPGRGQRLISFFKKRIRFFKKLIFFFKKLISGA